MTPKEFLQEIGKGEAIPCPGCGLEAFLITVSMVDCDRQIRAYGGQWQQRLVPYYRHEGSCPRCCLNWLYDEKSLKHKLWYHEQENTFDIMPLSICITRRKRMNPWYGRQFGKDDVIEGAEWIR